MKRQTLTGKKRSFAYQSNRAGTIRRARQRMHNEPQPIEKANPFLVAQRIKRIRRCIEVERDGNVVRLVGVTTKPATKPMHVELAHQLLRSGLLNEWEVDFLIDIQKHKKLTAKQQAQLMHIEQEVERCG